MIAIKKGFHNLLFFVIHAFENVLNALSEEQLLIQDFCFYYIRTFIKKNALFKYFCSRIQMTFEHAITI